MMLDTLCSRKGGRQLLRDTAQSLQMVFAGSSSSLRTLPYRADSACTQQCGSCQRDLLDLMLLGQRPEVQGRQQGALTHAHVPSQACNEMPVTQSGRCSCKVALIAGLVLMTGLGEGNRQHCQLPKAA